ncbi:hypothetical protein D3C72_1991450 [compost metagenome]
MRGVRHHDDDDVGTLGDFLGAGADGHACIDQRLRGRVDVMHEQRVAGGAQVARHRCAHDAQADEADVALVCHIDVSLYEIKSVLVGVGGNGLPQGYRSGHCTPCAARQPSPASVAVFGLYSQPIQPV